MSNTFILEWLSTVTSKHKKRKGSDPKTKNVLCTLIKALRKGEMDSGGQDDRRHPTIVRVSFHLQAEILQTKKAMI